MTLATGGHADAGDDRSRRPSSVPRHRPGSSPCLAPVGQRVGASPCARWGLHRDAKQRQRRFSFASPSFPASPAFSSPGFKGDRRRIERTPESPASWSGTPTALRRSRPADGLEGGASSFGHLSGGLGVRAFSSPDLGVGLGARALSSPDIRENLAVSMQRSPELKSDLAASALRSPELKVLLAERMFSSPDLRAPLPPSTPKHLKLAPLSASTPVSAKNRFFSASAPASWLQEDPVSSSKRRSGQLLHSEEKEQLSPPCEEASWAAATLSSLFPKPEIEIPQSTRHADAEMLSRLELQDVEDNRGAWRSVDPVEAFLTLDGGPSTEEALARLIHGAEGFSEPELVRMNICFGRHKDADCPEVQKEDLQGLLVYLGYLFVKKCKVDSLAQKISDFSTFEFREFEHLTMDWCAFEHEEIRRLYDSFDNEGTHQVPAKDLPKMLRSLGIVVVRSVVRDVSEIAKLSEHGNLSINDFFRFLATYRAVEGFTRAQIASARKVFEDSASSSSSGQGGNSLKPKKKVLADALLKVHGEHIAAQLPELFEGIHWGGCKGAHTLGISFHEFMVWGRKLRDIQLRKLDVFFCEVNPDPHGFVTLSDLVRMMKQAGFTLFSKAIEEIIADMNLTCDSKFDFSDYVRILKACQKRAGFTRFELDELVSAFKRHDYDRNEGIDHLELLDLLRYLGYCTHLKDVHQFVGQVDFNGNGSMDYGEFLYLMRLHREEELVTTLKIFDESKDAGSGEVCASELEECLQKLGHMPRTEVLEILLNDIGNPEQISFEKFMQVVDRFRRMSNAEKRKRAGFSDKEFRLICKLFEKHNVHKKNKLEKGELILLLIDAGIFMNTADARAEIFMMLDKARASAAKAGIEEEKLGCPGSPRCMFWPLVHLVRAVFHKDDLGAVRREDEAVDETRFEPQEVTEFRTIFLECSKWQCPVDCPPESAQAPAPAAPQPAAVAASRGRRASLPMMMASPGMSLSQTQPLKLGTATASACPPPSSDGGSLSLKECLGGNPSAVRASAQGIQVVMFNRRMNMRLSAEQRKELEHQVQKLSGSKPEELPAGMVDFANFLRLMKWMLQTSFSNINEVAEKVVDQQRKQEQDETSDKVVATVSAASAAVCLKTAFQRRKSV